MATYDTFPTSSSKHLEHISRAKTRLKAHLGTRRPWSQILDHRSIKLPSSLSDAIQRIKTNLTYFAMNYIIISLIILFLSLLWHPISLIVFVVMMAMWLFLYFLRDEPIVVFGRTMDERVVVVVLAVLTLLFLFLTGATWNILVAVLVAGVVVLCHAVFRKTDDLDKESGELYSEIPSSSA